MSLTGVPALSGRLAASRASKRSRLAGLLRFAGLRGAPGLLRLARFILAQRQELRLIILVPLNNN